jgi:D-tyrosyl-tRNA(Tyr) deacylase
MRIVIQRVREASVKVGTEMVAKINQGMLILVGIEPLDSQEDADWLVQKLSGMRIFNDEQGKMNLSVTDIQGQFLVISQFTLFASTKKGNRPSYIQAAPPEVAIPLYEYFVGQLKNNSRINVETGIFGADMQIALVNDGPVTILMDSKNKQ